MKPLFSIDDMGWVSPEQFSVGSSVYIRPFYYESNFHKQIYLEKIKNEALIIEKRLLNNTHPNTHASLKTLKEVFNLLKTEIHWIPCPVTLRMGYDSEYTQDLYNEYNAVLACCVLENSTKFGIVSVEIVFFSALSLTIGVLLHEMAHIKHLDHSDSFESTRQELIDLYYKLTDNI